MSKYYKAEDVERLIENILNVMIGKEEPMETALCDLPTIEVSEDVICQGRGDMFNDCQAVASAGQEMYVKGYEDGRKSVEVSEDCISREDAVNALIAHFIPQTYTGDDVDYALKLARKIIDNAPSVIPQVPNEDCISRADLIESFLADNECKREEAKACMCSLDLMLELIENAPSVVPRLDKEDLEDIYEHISESYVEGYIDGHAEGEWIEHKRAEEYDGLMQSNFECSQCHDWLRERTNYCPNCGAKMKG